MENLKWIDKWYSGHVIENFKQNVKIEISTKDNLGWHIFIDFSETDYKHLSLLEEKKKVSDFNYYMIKAKDKTFTAEGDFTKLDFIIGKFRAYIGETNVYASDHDNFLNPEIQRFIFEDDKKAMIFLHYTADYDTANSIVNTGFQFSVAFDKTTTSVFNDPIDLNYNHLVRKPFGRYVIVISISKKLYDKYSKLINRSGNKYLKVEEVLTESEIFANDSDENVYTLHKSYVKGYFNYVTGEVRINKAYDCSYDSDQFKKNIK